MATAFATLADVTLVGLPSSALGVLTVPQQQACVDWANADAGSRLAGRYPGINQGGAGWTWDYSVTGYVVALARKRMLDVRGRAPSTASADKLIDDLYAEAIAWFESVQKQAVHPYITGGEAAGATSQGPVMVSSSAAYTYSSDRLANRGI
jgi:hypothetical protein